MTQDFPQIILGLAVFGYTDLQTHVLFFAQFLLTKIVQLLVLLSCFNFTITFDSDALNAYCTSFERFFQNKQVSFYKELPALGHHYDIC